MQHRKFKPAAELFPHWICAVPVLESLVPDNVDFEAVPDDARLELFPWLGRLVGVVPPECEPAAQAIKDELGPVLWSIYGDGLSERFRGQKMHSATYALISEFLNDKDRRYQDERRPSYRQIVRHYLGIEPMMLDVKFETKFTSQFRTSVSGTNSKFSGTDGA